MPARKKGRVSFDYKGRSFLWWFDDCRYLHICSTDKRFVVALVIGGEDWPVLKVSGPEFPGVSRQEVRPVWLRMPDLQWDNTGQLVNDVLAWSFDATQTRFRLPREPRSAGPPPASPGPDEPEYPRRYVEHILQQVCDPLEARCSHAATLLRRFPFALGRLQWWDVPGAFQRHWLASDPDFNHELRAFTESWLAARRLTIPEQLILCPDRCPHDYCIPNAALFSCAGELLQLPQHYYIFPADADWCLGYSMESDAAIGLATAP